MRKMTSLLLAAGMTMALLSGCGGGTEAKETTAAQTTAAETHCTLIMDVILPYVR